MRVLLDYELGGEVWRELSERNSLLFVKRRLGLAATFSANCDIEQVMIVLTGGAGFIGSVFLSKLNTVGRRDVLVVDHLASSDKWKNLVGKQFLDYLPREVFLELLTAGRLAKIDAIVHLGACSSTTETNIDYLISNNYQYSKALAGFCGSQKIRYVYASSASTYGAGEHGYSDEAGIEQLRPMNGYGFSKQLFDLYMSQTGFAHSAAGVKFFNVFGPNEYHKGSQSSLIPRAVSQVQERGEIRLFKSNTPSLADGDQSRDFVYVKDCCDVLWWLLEHPEIRGIFNLGTGRARTWNDLAKAVFAAMNCPAKIEYIEMPESLRSHYQNFTEATMDKLAKLGAPIPQTSLEDAIRDYVQGYLMGRQAYL